MPRVILAEDSRTQAAVMRFTLEDAGCEVEIAANGLEALKAVGRQPPDAVLTDLDMPEMNGRGLAEAMAVRHPAVPVILLTTAGSEDIALPALANGAAGYISKKDLAEGIAATLLDVTTIMKIRGDQRLASCFTGTSISFNVESDLSLAAAIAGYVRCAAEAAGLGNENLHLRLAVAVDAAIRNAIVHGNLELADSPPPDESGKKVVEDRRRVAPYNTRRVRVEAQVNPREAICVVRDEGRGFDHAAWERPLDFKNTQLDRRRGLMLMKLFTDELKFNAAGNEVTLVKRAAK